MNISFQLRFAREQIGSWAERYSYPGEKAINELAADAKKYGHLTKQSFVQIGHWKSPRIVPRCNRNDDDFVRAVTTTSLSTPNERLKIEILTLLCGVEWPTASVILHFCASDRYPILDFRALWSLCVDVPKAYDFEFWWQYVQACRLLADQTGVTMRTLDRALWQFSKENQPPKPA